MDEAVRHPVSRCIDQDPIARASERRVLLSVLVTRKDSHNPGPGFFELAANVDDAYMRANSDSAYVSAQVKAVFKSYGA
jgi:hypothetical protein